MLILVTGAAGFIGSHVVDSLLRRGDQVVGVDSFDDYYDPARKEQNLACAKASPRFRLHRADVRDAEAISRVADSGPFDVVIHLAAMAGVRYSINRAPLYVDVNIQGTVNVLEASRAARVPHIVFASTSSVYGRASTVPFREDLPVSRPLAPYPATKAACEAMGHAYHNMFDLSFTALRFFSVYGPRGRPDMMPYRIADSIASDTEFVLFDDGDMFRDWTYVDDVVTGIVAAADRPRGFECINLGRGEPVQMKQFVELVERLMDRRARYQAVPAPASEPHTTFADISKARELLDYAPATSIEQGMARFLGWFQAAVLGEGVDAI